MGWAPCRTSTLDAEAQVRAYAAIEEVEREAMLAMELQPGYSTLMEVRTLERLAWAQKNASAHTSSSPVGRVRVTVFGAAQRATGGADTEPARSGRPPRARQRYVLCGDHHARFYAREAFAGAASSHLRALSGTACACPHISHPAPRCCLRANRPRFSLSLSRSYKGPVAVRGHDGRGSLGRPAVRRSGGRGDRAATEPAERAARCARRHCRRPARRLDHCPREWICVPSVTTLGKSRTTKGRREQLLARGLAASQRGCAAPEEPARRPYTASAAVPPLKSQLGCAVLPLLRERQLREHSKQPALPWTSSLVDVVPC